MHTFHTIRRICRALIALQEMLHSAFPTIPCRATAAPQEMPYKQQISQYSLQSSSSSTGDATECLRFHYSLQGLVAPQGMLHSARFLLFPESHSSSTQDATKCVRFLLFPVELQQLDRRCYTAALQETTQCAGFLLFPVELQWLYRRCCTMSTFPTSPIALQQLHRDATLYACLTFLCTPTAALQECYTA